MKCMRCGRDIEAGQVFCPECLQNMSRHPVNPGTAIRIPRRPDPQLKRAARRKAIPEEEQIRILKKRLKLMTILFVICVVILIAMAIPAAFHFATEHNVFLPGQNYSSITGG